MNRSESKYFNTAVRMDEALIALLEKKDFEYITVKELCEAAGVNRSTFYLHYETVGDLLGECMDYTVNKRDAWLRERSACFDGNISTAELDELILISPRYLTPYLEFVRENRRMFQVVLRHSSLMDTERVYKKMFASVFSPVLDRFQIPEEEKRYRIAFYVHGLIAIVSEWLKNDCADPIETVVDICIKCVLPNKEWE